CAAWDASLSGYIV
nr:immunoglobulin light chain junction region [Macaca mulatta]